MEIQSITQYTQDLDRLEGIIRQNLTAFYEVGRALMEIRDRGLYRDVKGYETFEAYCKAEWDFTGRQAERLMVSAVVIENTRPIGRLPATESQCRPLARLEPEQQREVWKKAVETAPDGKVTAAHVSKIAKEITDVGKASPTPEPPVDPRLLATSAMHYATMAITNLEGIRMDDPKRTEALIRVMKWIQIQLKE